MRETMLLSLCLMWLTTSFCAAQHVVNRALRMKTRQSSSHNKFQSGSAAVDGEIPGGVITEFMACIHTSANLRDASPWWEVDLGHKYPIAYVTIYARPGFLYRMLDTTVTIDNENCFSMRDIPTTSPIHLSCNTALTGRIVRIARHSRNLHDATLNMCEVQVLVCTDGRYGATCRQTCGHCHGEICDKTSGRCPRGCDPGWEGETCHTSCRDGLYGWNCSQSCGHCANSSACNKVTGRCPGGCVSGWRDDFCQTACQDGKYGWKCFQSCGKCANFPCDKVTGKCPKGCEAGWKGDMCEKECEEGKFGANCRRSCGRCHDNEACDKETGKCAKGCSPGWLGDLCHQNCVDGSYGDGCNQTCGQCRHQQDCHHEHGFCSNGCLEGFQGTKCMEPVDTSTRAVGVVGGIIFVIILVAVVIFLIVRRQRLQRKPVYNDRLTPPHPADESQTPDVHYINNRVTLVSSLPVSNDEYATVTKTATLQTHPNSEFRQRPSPADSLGAADVYVNLQTEALLTAGDQTSHLEARMQAASTASKTAGVSLRMLTMDVEKKLRFIDDEFSKLPSGLIHDCKHGSQKENHYKNRFNTILPYDFNRVVLEKVKGDNSSDYINASFINGYHRDKAYIAAQGPRNNTTDDFWRMVWQENVTQIIMLTNVLEQGKSKCFEYWPPKGENHVYGQVEVKCSEEDKRAHFVVRTLHVKPVNVKKFRLVQQLHYISWMDHEVPSTIAITEFLKFAKSHNSASTLSPPLVHCSAGVGRTGTYIALDVVMDQVTEEGTVKVLDVVKRLRDDRCSMVQNKEQYSFLYEVVLEAYSSLNTRREVAYFDRFSLNTTNTTADDKAVDTEFQLQNLQLMRHRLEKPRYKISTSSENRDKNRNMNALPSDNHLAYLTAHVRGKNNYISAVFAATVFDARGFILTQLPLSNTIEDIWRLVESYGVSNIVSLGSSDCLQTNLHPYWPTKEEKLMTENYSETLLAKAVLGVNLQSYSLKWERKHKHGEVRLLCLSDWRDKVPGNCEDLLHLLQLMLGVVLDTKSCPVVIQCIDGAARSGLFCVLFNIITQMISDHTADIFGKVREIQAIRPEVVSSLEEYRFCYEVVHRFRSSQCLYANR